MSTNLAIQNRLDFLAVNEETRSALQEVLPVIEEVLPQALESFYAHVGRWPELIRMFGTEPERIKAVMAHAREAQGRHWRNLFSGRFDESYVASVRKIGLTHSRIGLEPSWYIGGYTFTMNFIFAAITRYSYSNGISPEEGQQKANKMIRAVTQAIMLDMDLAISIYIEENKNTYDKKLAELAADFDASVGKVVDAVSKTANLSVPLSPAIHGSQESSLKDLSVSSIECVPVCIWRDSEHHRVRFRHGRTCCSAREGV